jgi:hypothetical protein
MNGDVDIEADTITSSIENNHHKNFPQNGIGITLYPLVIKDWPDISNRVIMWSHRKTTRLNSKVINDMIQLLSKLRINMLHLVIDCLNDNDNDNDKDDYKASENGIDHVVSEFGMGDNEGNRIGPNTNTNKNKNWPLQNVVPTNTKSKSSASVYANTNPNHENTKLFAIYEVCLRHAVQLVPTVAISSTFQNLDIDKLRNCNSTSINLLFLYEQREIANEILQTATSASASAGVAESKSKPFKITTKLIEKTVERHIIKIFQQTQLAGFHSITIGATIWTQKAADPLRLSSLLGISALFHEELDIIYPTVLFTKPILSSSTFMNVISSCVLRSLSKCYGV